MPSPISTAFVLGAGLGTRLRPLTNRRPKPLVPICNKPLITFAFDHLIAAGVGRFVVNTHHCPERYAEFFPGQRYRGHRLDFRHEPELLETGGGIRNVEDLLGRKPFIVYNGDILTDLPVRRAIDHHEASGNAVTMVLRSGGGPLHVSLDARGERVLDIRNLLGAGLPGTHLFTGIYVCEPPVIDRIPDGEKISIIPVLLDMIRRGERVGAVVLDEGNWWDVGTLEQYLAVHRYFFHAREHLAYPTGEEWPVAAHPAASLASNVELHGATFIGAGATIGRGSWLSDCIIWEGGTVAPGSRLAECIVVDGAVAAGEQTNGIFGREQYRPRPEPVDFIEQMARAGFPELQGVGFGIEPLHKGGSDRKFFRVRAAGQTPMIALHYIGDQAQENERYVKIAEFLCGLGVNVPRILRFDPLNGLVWMSDLGETDLWSHRHARRTERMPLYRSALDQVYRLHSAGVEAAADLPLQGGFDFSLYHWEQEYFRDNCLGRHFGVNAERLDELGHDSALEELAGSLARRPRVLVHRDFQSQNIMIDGGKAWLIDFQGMREGLAEYDLASLLHDPYVALGEDERYELLDYYLDLCERGGTPTGPDFHRTFDLCAIQRLMQALGAYGFLGHAKGKPRFLGYIEPALHSLSDLLHRAGGFENLDRVVAPLLK